MSDVLKLGDVAVVKGGSGFPEKYQGGSHGLPFIKVSDMNLPGNQRYIWKSNNYLDSTTCNLLKPTVFPKDTVIFAKVGAAVYLNKRRILTEDTAIDNNLMGVTAASIEPLFLYYLLQSVDLAEWVQPGALPSINQKIIDALPVPIMDREQQKYISEVLNAIDNQIDATQALIDKYTAIKQGIMADLFSRGIDPETKALRPTFEEVPELYHKTPLGMLPKGWDVSNLGSISLKVTDGSHQAVSTIDNGCIPFLFVSCVRGGKILWDKCSYISRKDYHLISKGREPRKGDILYTAVGSYGHAALVTEDSEFSFQRHIAYVKPNPQIIDSGFLSEFLNSELIKSWADRVALGNAQKTVTLGELSKFPIVVPGKNEQEKVVERFQAVNKVLESEYSELSKLQQTKQGLMQDLLTGKVPVPA